MGNMIVAPTVDTEEAAPAPHGSVRSIGALREELRQRKETGDWEVAEAQSLAEELRGLLTSVDQAVEQKKEGHAAAAIAKAEAVAPPPAAKAEAVTPTSIGADRFRKLDALLESIRSGAVRPLRGSHIIKRAKAGQPLLRRQELPGEAFYDYDDLMRLLQKLRDKYGSEDTVEIKKIEALGGVAAADIRTEKRGGDTRFMSLLHALSYRWITKDHPDPECFHLRIVAEVAEARINDVNKSGKRIGLWRDVFEPIGMSEDDVDIAIFWDFGSLYQSDRVKHVDDRTEAQKQLFGGALGKGGALNVWYGHLHTSVWIQSELPEGFEEQMAALNLARTYKESGWCFVEASMSALLKPYTRRLDLGMRNIKGDKYVEAAAAIQSRGGALRRRPRPAAQPTGHVGGGAYPEAVHGQGRPRDCRCHVQGVFRRGRAYCGGADADEARLGSGEGVRAGGGAAALHLLPQAQPGA